MHCNACCAEVSRETLHLTAEGQALCTQCYGKYLSTRATLSARAHEVYRRCTCGAVLAPMADPETRPYVDGNLGEFDLAFFFQPRRYECGSCGTSFGVPHVLMTSLSSAIILVFCVYAFLRPARDDGMWLLPLLGFLGVVVYDGYYRIRYPRVASAD
jgi:hypothetical protein